MYICNKCGRETPNPDMLCDDCRPKKPEAEKEVTEQKKVVLDETKQSQQKEDKMQNNDTNQNTNLMYCPDCGNKISRNALQCPHCGCPFERDKKDNEKEEYEKEKVLIKHNDVKAISYITTVVGYILSAFIFGIGFLIPLCWLIYFCVFISGKDKNKYDLSWYIKLRNEFIILTILGLPVIILF